MAKRESKNAPLRQAGDSPEMAQTIDWIETEGIAAIRPTPYQVKIEGYNFYPGKGTIYIDREPKVHPVRGLTELKRLFGVVISFPAE